MIVYFLFVLVLSIDTFMAALTYEGSKIKIPLLSNLVISGICAFSLIFSLFLGNTLENVIPGNILKWISFFILFGLGIFKLFDNHIKKMIQERKFKDKKLKLSFCNLNLIIEVYGDYAKADVDMSNTLSKLEAITLALALSVDSITGGLAFNTPYIYFPIIFGFSFAINFLAILSTRIISNLKYDFSFLGGIIFIIMAFTRL